MAYLALTWLLWPWLALRARLRCRHQLGRILVIQVAKIGDAICSTPVLRALAERYPQASIDVLANPITVDLFSANPHVSSVFPLATGELAGWRGKFRLAMNLTARRYDAVVCLNAGLAYPLVSFWAGIPLRCAVLPNFCGNTYRLATGLWSFTEAHSGDQLIMTTYLRLLRHLGVADQRVDKEVFQSSGAELRVAGLFANDELSGHWIGVGVSAANKLKELGLPTLVEVIGAFLQRYPTNGVVLIGSQADFPLGQRVREAVGEQGRVRNLCGSLQLVELPALLCRLEVYLGVDSGITYMADALGIPIVSVAGPCNMNETRPLGANVVILQKFPPCAPCAHIFRAPYHCRIGTLECIRQIEAGEILEALEKCLRAAEQSAKGPKGIQ